MTTGRSAARRRFTLDDLFQDTSPKGEGVSDLEAAKEIRLDRIEPDPTQPRRTMDAGRFEELVASVRQEGILVPIEVSYDAERNVYVIVHGERRYRASREAGLTTIPALVREVDGRQRILHQLMENILREDLNAVDRARALRTLKEAMGGVAWELVADAVGIRRSRLFQLLDVIKLPDDLQEDIRAGRLSEKHGRAFKDLTAPRQAELRELVLEQRLSGDETVRVAQALRRAPEEISVREALTIARTARMAPPAAPTAEETAAVNGGPELGAGPALQGGSTSSSALAAPPEAASAPQSPDAAADAPWERGRLARPDPEAPAASSGQPALDLRVSGTPLQRLEASHAALAALLPDLAALDVTDQEQAVALLRSLRDLIDGALAQVSNVTEKPAD